MASVSSSSDPEEDQDQDQENEEEEEEEEGPTLATLQEGEDPVTSSSSVGHRLPVSRGDVGMGGHHGGRSFWWGFGGRYGGPPRWGDLDGGPP